MEVVERVLAWLHDRALLWNVFNTAMLVVTVLVGRWLTLRTMRRRVSASPGLLLRVRIVLRNASALIIVIGATTIWANELRTLAISLVAVAAAIVIATKELILCMSGALYRGSNDLFEVGDRVEIAGFRGDVIDLGLFSTTIMEVAGLGGAQTLTGRAVEIPNAVFLSAPIVNETFVGGYIVHTFDVPNPRGASVDDSERTLLAAAQQHTTAHVDGARAQFKRVALQFGVDIPTLEAHVARRLVGPDEIRFAVRVVVPVRQRAQVEESIARALEPRVVTKDPSAAVLPS
jgi:small-conductance mechanosensitive channel